MLKSKGKRETISVIFSDYFALNSLQTCYTAGMSLRYFDPLKRILYIVSWGAVAACIFVSVVSSQVAGPYYYRFANRDPRSVLPILKAIVATGDIGLLKSAFGTSVNDMYEKVFEQYVSQDNLKAKITELERKVPESRDLEMSKGYIAAREKNFEDAAAHFAKAKEIDPLVFVPIAQDFQNLTPQENNK